MLLIFQVQRMKMESILINKSVRTHCTQAYNTSCRIEGDVAHLEMILKWCKLLSTDAFFSLDGPRPRKLTWDKKGVFQGQKGGGVSDVIKS